MFDKFKVINFMHERWCFVPFEGSIYQTQQTNYFSLNNWSLIVKNLVSWTLSERESTVYDKQDMCIQFSNYALLFTVAWFIFLFNYWLSSDQYEGHPISSDNGLISQKLLLKSEFYYPLYVAMYVAYSCLTSGVFTTT